MSTRSEEIDNIYNELDNLLFDSQFDDVHNRCLEIVQDPNCRLYIVLSALIIIRPYREKQLVNAHEMLSSKASELAMSIGGKAKVIEISKFL